MFRADLEETTVRLVMREFPFTETTRAELPTGTLPNVATLLSGLLGDISIYREYSTLIENQFQFHLRVLACQRGRLFRMMRRDPDLQTFLIYC